MPCPLEAINNVYELPSIKPAIRYLRGATGFPTKSTWIKSICKGNYLTWSLLTVKNVNKFFPESEESQKRHMRNQRQGVQSTKKKAAISPITASSKSTAQKSEDDEGAPAIEKKNNKFIATYNPRNTMFTNQTGKFPHSSSRGNNYQMITHEIDGNSTWVEPMKNQTEGEMILARRRALQQMIRYRASLQSIKCSITKSTKPITTKFELPTWRISLCLPTTTAGTSQRRPSKLGKTIFLVS